MLKNENINQETKVKESRKARISAIVLSVIYYPILLAVFNYYYKVFIEKNELTLFKFASLSLLTAVIISSIIAVITKIISRKYYIRDKQELKNAFIFSFLIYAIIQILYLLSDGLLTVDTRLHVGIYIFATGVVFYIFLFDYDVSKLGIYTNDFEDFIFYSTERKFIFKNDLRAIELQNSNDPLDELTTIVKNQKEELPLQNDLNNIGKYYTYFIQKYDYEDKVYVLIFFSHTGKRTDEIISNNKSYSKEEYSSKLETLNDEINTYLKYE